MNLYTHKLTQGLKTRGTGQSWWLSFGFCLLACLFVCFKGYEITSCMFTEVAHDGECRKERKININVPYKILSIILVKPYEFLFELFTAAELPSSYSQVLPIISGPWQWIFASSACQDWAGLL